MVSDGRAQAERGTLRRAEIESAALTLFSDRGPGATSMADIARAAGMSRPALYQYFPNKAAIVDAVFLSVFERLAAGGLAALGEPGPMAERLDGFLQRYKGDLWALMAASPHADELVGSKSEQVSAAVGETVDRCWEGVAAYLAGVAGSPERCGEWVELLRLGPVGLVSDRPAVAVYRQRLRCLAHAVAADIGSG